MYDWFQIFPIEVKGSAGSLVSVVSWFGSWIVTYSFNLASEWSSAGNSAAAALSLGSSGLCSSVLVLFLFFQVEMKRG